MQIKIKYLPVGRRPPKLEILTTPWDSGWERVECEIVSTEGNLETGIERDHTWMIYMDQTTREPQKIAKLGDGIDIQEIFETYTYRHDYERVLSHSCGSVEDYIAWLEETVMYIAIDGEIFWANDSYQDAQMQARKEVENAVEDDGVLDELFGV